MRIALYSDLHLELMHGPPWRPAFPEVDVVILAGDIGRHTHGLEWAADTFRSSSTGPRVIYVAGNHEYHGAHLGMLSELRKPQWKTMGVHFLENEVYALAGVRFLGGTLWSAFDLHGVENAEACMSITRRSISDYWIIHASGGKRLEPGDTLAMHRKSVQWLDAELAKPFDGKTVVVTHFTPHRKCVATEHEGSELSPYFNTDLAWLMEKRRIDVWCHGHTHTNNDFVAENGCRVVSNQRGYPMEVEAGNMGFRPALVIDI